MSGATEFIICFCLIFIAVQSFECAKFLQKIYRAKIEQKSIDTNLLSRTTQIVNFLDGIEGPLHRFIKENK